MRAPSEQLSRSQPIPVHIDGAAFRTESSGHRVISVTDPNALTQVIGWLKFRSRSGQVFFRGQTDIFPSMQASAFRGRSQAGLDSHSHALAGYVDQLAGGACRCLPKAPNFSRGHDCTETISSRTHPRGIVGGTYRACIEPLLQHYGIATRWLDIVDNIWIALWFACYEQRQKGRYAYHLKRSWTESPTGCAYIFVFDLGPADATQIPGYLLSESARIVDLRYSVPSIYLRPHAQHGLLVAPRKLTHSDKMGDLLGNVPYIVEISLKNAIDWLGDGTMLSTYVLFPPAARDGGYRRLLEYAMDPPTQLGAFTQFGPSAV